MAGKKDPVMKELIHQKLAETAKAREARERAGTSGMAAASGCPVAGQQPEAGHPGQRPPADKKYSPSSWLLVPAKIRKQTHCADEDGETSEDASTTTGAGSSSVVSVCSKKELKMPAGSLTQWVYKAPGDVERKHHCRECRQSLCLSEILLEQHLLDGREDNLHDTHGYLNGRCFTCATGHGPWGKQYAVPSLCLPDEKMELALVKFHKQASRKRTLRAKAASGQWDTLRSRDFEAIIGEIDKEIEFQLKQGKTIKRTRATLIAAARTWLQEMRATIINDIENMKAEQKRHVELANLRYEEELKKTAESGGDHVATPHGIFTDAHALDYADHITPNVLRLYLCRRRDCLHFFRNNQWITTDVEAVLALSDQPVDDQAKWKSGYQFRCPQCGEAYSCFGAESSTLIAANFVVTFTGPGGAERMVLMELPGSAVSGWFAGIMEATHEMIDPTIKDMSRGAQIQALMKMMQQFAPILHMKPMKVSAYAKQHTDWINASSTKKLWYYHHLNDGILGASLHDPEFKDMLGGANFRVMGGEAGLVMTAPMARHFIALLHAGADGISTSM